MLQADLGRAEGLLRSGRALLYQTIMEIWQIVCDGRLLGVSDRAMLSLASTHAASSAIQAVDLAFSAAGSASILPGPDWSGACVMSAPSGSILR